VKGLIGLSCTNSVDDWRIIGPKEDILIFNSRTLCIRRKLTKNAFIHFSSSGSGSSVEAETRLYAYGTSKLDGYEDLHWLDIPSRSYVCSLILPEKKTLSFPAAAILRS
jgi:hypothetical protein